MKLESLKSSKFEAMTNEAMKFIVGGGNCATGSGSYCGSNGTETKYSNDYTDDKGVKHNVGYTIYNNGTRTAGNGDYSQATLDGRGVAVCK